MKAKFTLFLVSIISICSQNASSAADGSSTHFGDRLALHFQQGKYHAAKLVADFDETAVISPIDTKTMAWIVEHRDQIQKELLSSEQEPRDELPDTCSALHACACTGNKSLAAIFISLNQCKDEIKTTEDAGQMLLHEVVHHFNIADERFANDVAIAVYEAWHNLGGTPAPKANWEPMNKEGEPEPIRIGASMVSSGTDIIVWGGGGKSRTEGTTNTGGIYNLKRNEWRPTTYFGSPKSRAAHTATWAENQMIVWGGRSSDIMYGDGRRYVPSDDNGGEWSNSRGIWLPMSSVNAPIGRYCHSSVWTGKELIVFGGSNLHYFFADGGLYNPETDTWRRLLQTADSPTPRCGHAAVWTGPTAHAASSDRMLIWGGYILFSRSAEESARRGLPRTEAVTSNDGWIYDVQTNQWKKMSAHNAPSPRTGFATAWTGTHLIVWGGEVINQYRAHVLTNDGAAYDPEKDQWTSLPTLGAPDGRRGAQAVWTGTSLMVFGGSDLRMKPVQKGGILKLIDGVWTWQKPGRLNLLAPSVNANQLAVWTGKNFIKWGGESDDSAGGIYFPEGR